MEASRVSDSGVTLSMSISEAVVLHELIASSEFAADLEIIELPEPVAKKVMSDVQQALVPLISTLGTREYESTITSAYRHIDPGPYRV